MGEHQRSRNAPLALLREARAMHAALRLADAKTLYRRALDIDPSLWEAWHGLGDLARHVGAMDAALQSYANALALAPDDPDLIVANADALQAAGQLERAGAQLELACRLRPEDATAWERLGIVRQSLGDTAAAESAYRRACALAPASSARLKLCTLASPIADSRESIAGERARVAAEVDALLRDDAPRFDDLMQGAPWTNFYLAFQGENDRALQIRFAELYRRVCPSLDYVAPHCLRPRARNGRLRIGIISKFLCNHSIGRTSRGLFAGIASSEFDVTAMFIAPAVDDDYSRFIRQHAERHVVVPYDLIEARRIVESLELDVLFYQDIGMEPFSYFLAFSRLARVQCVSFGHPDTTGIPAMDYFISNDLYETPAAQAHYSERLFLLHDLASLAHYYRPALPQPMKTRDHFRLQEASHLYLCPQNLFKFHPDMDGLIAGILRRDPQGRLVVVEGRIRRWTELLRARWAIAMPDVADRVECVPRQGSADYVNLIALADVMLDTVHFNGMNTSLEALSVGTPVVTLPGEFQRGRHTQAMYRKMGMGECIATDAARYIDIAVRLGTDRDYRRQVHEKILARNGVLFEDPRVVREFERFFREAIARLDAPPVE